MSTVTRAVSAAIDTAMDRTVVPGFSSIGYAIRRRLPTWPADPEPGALAGTDIIVTGAASGLGARTAADLAALGAHVHLLVRDPSAGDRTADAIRREVPHCPPLTVWRCDVSDLTGIRAFTDAYLAAGHGLHGIVHNAGVLPSERIESAQGHELAMAVHVLGPIAMTEQLLPRLEGTTARVVFVTSGGMYAQRLRADDPDFEDGKYSGTAAYARSKRAQVALLPILTNRWGWHGVATYAMHPGWAATPGVAESLPAFDKVAGPILRDLAAGADTTVWLLATQPRPRSGGLWQDRHERPSTMLPGTRTTEADRGRMWQWVLEAIAAPA